ncbi:Potassium channel subfamily K member 10 [Frankliniella fusca]|uniref:Potassium channel subfamily K member 10 n=1 Tax=Frankliniella fusca TaxID=407009 RepID=A0AAE1LPA0_9NEOP|nr:Potassium channel subfamily K member 10 [Frankliniella fusca]
MMDKSQYEPHAQARRESMGALGGMGVRAHVREVLGMRRSSALLLLFVFFYLGYLVAGGLVFATIEAPTEAQLKGSLLRARQAFLDKHPCVSDATDSDTASFKRMFPDGCRASVPGPRARLVYLSALCHVFAYRTRTNSC